MISKIVLYFVLLHFLGCSTGKLDLVCTLPTLLDEVSGLSVTEDPNVFWMIEDSGNTNHLYAVATTGEIRKEIVLHETIRNVDWEALTIDPSGVLYIGDFGNNSKKRKAFEIYKVIVNDRSSHTNATAQKITFKLPENQKKCNFEAFFVLKNSFYLFSKQKNKTNVWKVPNKIGDHVARFVTTFQFEERHSKITDAAINKEQSMIALLNHDKVWLLENFKGTNFFEGTITKLPFEHRSQKEGICFATNEIVWIVDERVKVKGGNLYKFRIQPHPKN